MSFICYNPTSGPTTQEVVMAKRLTSLENCVLGVIDNGKTNSDTFLNQIAKRLEKICNLKEVIWLKKHSFSHALSDDEVRQLSKQCNFVLTGVGD